MAFENCCLNGKTLKVKVSSFDGTGTSDFIETLKPLLLLNGLEIIKTEQHSFSQTVRIGRTK